MKSNNLKEAKKLREKAENLEAKAIQESSPAECREAAKKIKKRKANVAVFLGAGASKSFGWPLTNELLPAILQGIIDDDLFEDTRINTRSQNRKDRLLLKEVLGALCPGIQFKQHYLDGNKYRLPLVTSLLSMIDFSLATGQSVITGFVPEEMRKARELMERSIYEIVEHVTEETGPNYWPMRKASGLTRALTNWLDGVREDTAQIGIVTSNYDLAIEQAWGFYRDTLPAIKKLEVDLGFTWLWASNGLERTVSRPAKPKRRLYKLHGSTNWMKCSLCGRIHINPGVDIAIYAFQRAIDENNSCHCGHARLEAQIVSPSFVRDGRTSNLESVWQSALDWLREAEDWIIIGYSFPDEDLNIRSLFARSLAAGKKPKITVVQNSLNEQTQTRYKAFFPSGQLSYLTGGLKMFVENTK